MKDPEIKDYRKILEKEFIDKDLEIETTVSYISIGALGFFITINEKFLRITEANNKVFLIISLIFLLLSFILILLRKYRTSHHDLKLIKFIDNMQSECDEDDKKLDILWHQSHSELSGLMKAIYITLAIGISLQVVFILININ
jgi:hypothetical protein